LLHEGTHVFMVSFLGGCGPGWYMEGIAELFATHRYDDQTGRLEMRIMPNSRQEVPMLGRIKLIDDAIADKPPLTIPAIMQFDNSRQLGNEAYAWCWALAKLLDTHPRYRYRFHALYKHVLDPKFNELFRQTYKDDWADLNTEWQAYITSLDHGYDFDRMAIDFRPGEVAAATGDTTLTVATDRGWQSTGIQLAANKSYKIMATGRYQIAVDERDGDKQPWPCEPGGVTIEYHAGHPLGMLLGAVIADGNTAPSTDNSFAKPAAIGLGTVLKPTANGTLYLRVNDSPATLGENQGSLTVTVQQVP
jgi:hypothetical protein